jgi:hypothetical protein
LNADERVPIQARTPNATDSRSNRRSGAAIPSARTPAPSSTAALSAWDAIQITAAEATVSPTVTARSVIAPA